MRFEAAFPARVVFGPGCAAEAGPALAAWGVRRVLRVTGREQARASAVVDALSAAGVDQVPLSVAGEPTVDRARGAVEAARDAGCDGVVAVGGGSALDLGKAVAGLLANGGDPLDYLEVVGRGLPLSRPAVPFVAVPTTAGTGTEATRNAVLASPAHGVKASLRSPHLLPRLALVDPDLTLGLPPDVTAATGLDALTQLIEPFTSNRAQPFTDALCREGIVRAARSLRRACAQGSDRAAREDMALASLFGGMALANAGLGAAHGFAAVLGGRFPAPHGALCARLLGLVMDANVRALRASGDAAALARYDEVARLLTGDGAATADDGAAFVASLCVDLAIPRLSAFGVAAADLPAVADATLRASSTKANPVALPVATLLSLLESAL